MNYVGCATTSEYFILSAARESGSRACDSPALVIYEYFLTLDREITLVWKRKTSAGSAGSALLISVRWTMILVELFGWLPITPQVRQCQISIAVLNLMAPINLGVCFGKSLAFDQSSSKDRCKPIGITTNVLCAIIFVQTACWCCYKSSPIETY